MTDPYKPPASESDRSSEYEPGAVVSGAVMSLGAYILAVFVGTALNAAKNGVGDGSMPSLGLSLSLSAVGLVFLAAGFAGSGRWLRNPDDPVSSFELFSVLICDPIPMGIGIYHLIRGRSRGARLLLTHAMILFVKMAVVALVWDPRL